LQYLIDGKNSQVYVSKFDDPDNKLHLKSIKEDFIFTDCEEFIDKAMIDIDLSQYFPSYTVPDTAQLVKGLEEGNKLLRCGYYGDIYEIELSRLSSPVKLSHKYHIEQVIPPMYTWNNQRISISRSQGIQLQIIEYHEVFDFGFIQAEYMCKIFHFHIISKISTQVGEKEVQEAQEIVAAEGGIEYYEHEDI
jgi:hypothetical protein